MTTHLTHYSNIVHLHECSLFAYFNMIVVYTDMMAFSLFLPFVIVTASIYFSKAPIGLVLYFFTIQDKRLSLYIFSM